MIRPTLLSFVVCAACFMLIACGGDGPETNTTGTQSANTDTQGPPRPTDLTTVKPTDATSTRQSEVARLTELADAAEAQGEYAQATAFMQAAMPLAISLEPPLRGTIEIAEPGHSPESIKQDMLSEDALMLVARQILRQANPFDASEQVVAEQLAQSIAAGLTVSPQTTNGEPPFPVIVECESKQLEWDPTRNWNIARQAVDRSIQNFIRHKLERRETILLLQRDELEELLARNRLAVINAQKSAAQFGKEHPGVDVENVDTAQEELEVSQRIAKLEYEKQNQLLAGALLRQAALQQTISDAPDVVETRTLSRTAAELTASIPALEQALEYHLVELRRPESHEKVIEVRSRLKQANDTLNAMPAEKKYDVRTQPNQTKLKAKADLADLNEQIEALTKEGQTMRDVVIRYDTTRKNYEKYRQQYRALVEMVTIAEAEQIVTESQLRETNDQLRSPTASQIRYIAAPPQFPTWTRMKTRLNALQQQAGQFGQIE